MVVIYCVGFLDSSSYYCYVDQMLGMMVKQFCKGGDNVFVCYVLMDWVYGWCLVVESEWGICVIFFGDSDEVLLVELYIFFLVVCYVFVDVFFQ